MIDTTQWFSQARFGMFIHYGPYSLVGRGEWLMAQEGWTREEYERFADTMRTEPAHIRQWVRLAKRAGMRYAVFTTKHHDGFCQWDSKANPYNSVNRGPKLDLVREFVAACRAEDLRVGLYYSLADWHHPDGAACATDSAARERFIAYTTECLRELMSGYGCIDLLWFDGPWPLGSPQNWDAPRITQMIRSFQPDILINDRFGNGYAGDFVTSERDIKAADGAWEACMTMNDDWGYTLRAPGDWVAAKDIALMLRRCSIGGGNLLLNVGPMGDGALPPEATERLERIGRWLAINGQAVYPAGDTVSPSLPFISNTGSWSRQGNMLYYWLWRAWPGETLHLGGLEGELVKAELLGCDRILSFTKHPTRYTIHGLPQSNPDTDAGVALLKLTFADTPHQKFPYPHEVFVY